MQNTFKVTRWVTAMTVAGAVLVGAAAQVEAAPLTVNPGVLSAVGPATAVFVFKEAADTSQLLAVSIAGVIFNNQTDAIGTTKAVGNPGPYPATITFELKNLSQGYSFFTGIADTVQVGGQDVFYAKYSNNFADFGVGPLSAAAQAAIAALPVAPIFVGFEDRRGGDYDYNDLIFAFESVRVGVPEPATLALFGMGLLGLAARRRRRS